MRKVLIKQVIKTLERKCRISQDVVRNNFDKTHPILQNTYCQADMVSNFKFLSLPWTALQRRCLESTSIMEIHTLKSKTAVSLYKLR